MRQFRGIVASVLGLLVAASGCSTTSAPGWTAGTVAVASPLASTESVEPSAAPRPIVRASDVKPRAEVDLIVRFDHYEIEGFTASQLLAQMEELGPTNPRYPGRSFAAEAHWQFDWDVDESRSLGVRRERCMIESTDIFLDVTITMPRWNRPGSASQALIAEWDRFLGRLRFHELGHKQIALRAAREAARATNGLVGPCGVVGERAELRIERVLAGVRALQESYDRVTRHGLTQGTHFNTSV